MVARHKPYFLPRRCNRSIGFTFMCHRGLSRGLIVLGVVRVVIWCAAFEEGQRHQGLCGLELSRRPAAVASLPYTRPCRFADLTPASAVGAVLNPWQ
jgi:hypothetical protein